MGKTIVNTWLLKGGATAQDLGCVLRSGNGVLVKYGIISIGYWLNGLDRKNSGLVHNLHNLKDYQEYYQNLYDEENKNLEVKHRKTWGKSAQAQLYDKLKKGDIVWTRVSKSIDPKITDGYYVAIVPDDPKNLFYCNGFEPGFDDLEKADCLVGINGIKWYGPFSEDAVPGSVTRYLQSKTLVCIDSGEEKNPVYDLNGNKWTYTSTVSYLMLCEKKGGHPVEFIKKDISKDSDMLEFFKLIGWRGLEDVSAFWLQQKDELFLQPSTCKSGTPGTEYVLIDPSSGKRVYVQTKNSVNKKITSDTYRSMLVGDYDEFYLISTGIIDSTSGNILVLKKNEKDDRTIPIKDLFDFVFNSENDKFLPKHIVDFKNMLF